MPLCLENHSSKARFGEDVELLKSALPHMHLMFQVEDAGRGKASKAYIGQLGSKDGKNEANVTQKLNN